MSEVSDLPLANERINWRQRAAVAAVIGAAIVGASGLGVDYLVHHESKSCEMKYEYDHSEAGSKFVTTPDGHSVQIHVFDQPNIQVAVSVAKKSQDKWQIPEYEPLPAVDMPRPKLGVDEVTYFELNDNWYLKAVADHQAFKTECTPKPTASNSIIVRRG